MGYQQRRSSQHNGNGCDEFRSLGLPAVVPSVKSSVTEQTMLDRTSVAANVSARPAVLTAAGSADRSLTNKLNKHHSALKSIRVASRKPSSPSKFRKNGTGCQPSPLSSTQPPPSSMTPRDRWSPFDLHSSADSSFKLPFANDSSSEAQTTDELDGTASSQSSGLQASAARLFHKRHRDRCLLQRSTTIAVASVVADANAADSSSSGVLGAQGRKHHQQGNAIFSSPQRRPDQQAENISQLDYFRTPCKTPRHKTSARSPANSRFTNHNHAVNGVNSSSSQPTYSRRLEELAGPMPEELRALRTPYRRLARNLFSSPSSQQPSVDPATHASAFSGAGDLHRETSTVHGDTDNKHSTNLITQPHAFYDYFEWSLLTKIRLTITKQHVDDRTFYDQLCKPLTAEQRAEAGLRAARNFNLLSHATKPELKLSTEEFQLKLAQALTFWAFPLAPSTPQALPHWTAVETATLSESSPITTNSARAKGMPNTAVGKENTQRFWEASLRELWSLTKSNLCPYFYIVSHHWTALVLSPSLLGVSTVAAVTSVEQQPAANNPQNRRGSSLILTDSPPPVACDSKPPPASKPVILLAKPPKGCISTLKSLGIEFHLWRYNHAGNAAAVATEPPSSIIDAETPVGTFCASVAQPEETEQHSINPEPETAKPSSHEAAVVRKRRHKHKPTSSTQQPEDDNSNKDSSRRKQPQRGGKRRRAMSPTSPPPLAENNNNNNGLLRTPSPSKQKKAVHNNLGVVLRTPDSPFPVGDILRGLKDAGRLRLVDEMSGAYHYRQAAIDTLQLLTICDDELNCDRFVDEFLIKRVENLLPPAATLHAYMPPLLLAPGPFLYGAQMQLEPRWVVDTTRLACMEIAGPVLPHVAPCVALLWQQLMCSSATPDGKIGTLAFIKHSASAILSSFFTAAADAPKSANPLDKEATVDLPLNNLADEDNNGCVGDNKDAFARNSVDEIICTCMRRFRARSAAFMLENSDLS